MARKAMKVWPLLLVAAVLLVLVYPPGGQADPGPKRFDRFTVFNMTDRAVPAEVTLVYGTTEKSYPFVVAKYGCNGLAPHFEYTPNPVKEIRCKILGKTCTLKTLGAATRFVSATFTWGEFTNDEGEVSKSLCGEAFQDTGTLVNDEP
jgi:hypothetical protein